MKHIPVMPNEIIENLIKDKNGVYVDATSGLGGHSKLILDSINKDGKLILLEKDPILVEKLKEKFKNFDNVTIIAGSYVNLNSLLNLVEIEKIDGIFFDLGVSSYHIDTPERGFSFDNEGPLDMRFDQNQVITAFDVVNGYSFAQLVEIFSANDEPLATKIARKIIQTRESNPITTTKQLADLIVNVYAKYYNGKKFKKHPASKVFQAIRIEVNNELEELRIGLEESIKLLKSGGRLVVLTFHSGEDKIVKEFFKRESKDCICPPKQVLCTCNHKKTLKILTKKPITPTKEEIANNPRSRSAKLRVAEKI